MEGPYYPVRKPADRDNDLTRLGGGTTAQGDVLVLNGRVVNQKNAPVHAARVELWQTDSRGVYMHPDDPGTQKRDLAFQFYGEATTDAGGAFVFRTVMPGLYGERPRHMHMKIIQRNGATLTTQIYFKGDDRLAGDFLTRRLGARLAALLIDPQPHGNELRADMTFVVESR
jgi:protocatechuate 3,4-dioxygenase beta subunit